MTIETSVFGMPTSVFAFLVVALIAVAVGVTMWAVQVVSEARRSPEGLGFASLRRVASRS